MRQHWMIGVVALAWVACSSETEIDPPPQQVEPKSTLVGTPSGSPVSMAIGTAGGSLSSADGRLTLEIPPGAFSKDETVGIQEISNEAHGKVGKAFRLTPEGVEFAQPVKLRYRYTDEEVKGTVPELLRMAYQDGKGFWHVYKQVTLDKAAKTLSVETRHFSDWSPVTGAQILPHTTSVLVDRNVDIKIVQCEVVNEEDEGSEAVITSLLALCESNPVGNIGATNWSVNGAVGGNSGAGTIQPDSDRSSGLARYSAPSQAPSQNPVSVSVEYTEPFETTQHLLTSIIQVVDPAAACGGIKDIATWDATFGMSFDFAGQNSDADQLSVNHFAEVTAHLEKNNESQLGVSWIGRLEGTVTIDDRKVESGTPQTITTLKGSSSPVNAPNILDGSRAYLNIDLIDCTYNVGMVLHVTAERTIDPGSAPRVETVLLGSVRTGARPIGSAINLTNGGDFIAHSEDWGLSNKGDAYFQAGLGSGIFDGFAAEGMAGSARVSWSYGPGQ